MKGRIIRILRSEKGTVSGERLSAALGISRVSVWKHIHRLQDLGYKIDSSPRGYRLKGSDDYLFPWEFEGREETIHFFPEIGSTMDTAMDMAATGSPHMTVVIAGIQKKGRGRMKRSWLSASGGLYFTMILRPRVPLAAAHLYGLSASMVLVSTLNRMFDIGAGLKWPNDILVKGKKLCGMLTEVRGEADMVDFINIGMGLNVNNAPRPREQAAVSIKQLLGKKVSKKQILSRFLDDFEQRIDSPMDTVVEEWKAHAVSLNRLVKIVAAGEEFEGMAMDVDDSGALLLKMDDGSIKKVVCGDCFLKWNNRFHHSSSE